MIKTSDKVLYNTIYGLLRPIIRICIRNSIKLNELIVLLKNLLVDVAKEELKNSKEEISISKISVMTGVHRRDVANIQSNKEKKDSSQLSLVAKVIHKWRYQDIYKTKAGQPKVLSIEGKQSEFAKLVESINGKDISPYTVLFEMERLGVVLRRNNRIKLMWKNYISEDVEEGLKMLVEDSSDMIAGVEENIFHPHTVKNLHLKTEYDNIPMSSEAVVRKWVLEEGSRFHEKVSKFLNQTARKAIKNEKRIRVSFGTFSYADHKYYRGEI